MTPDERKEARTYAWGYFALHADQRMKLFNFFLILSGLILGAFPAIRGMAGGAKVVALLPLLLVLTAFIFWRLEERTRRLVKNAENALRFLDEQWSLEPLSDKTPHYLRLFERDDHLVETLKNRSWNGGRELSRVCLTACRRARGARRLKWSVIMGLYPRHPNQCRSPSIAGQ